MHRRITLVLVLAAFVASCNRSPSLPPPAISERPAANNDPVPAVDKPTVTGDEPQGETREDAETVLAAALARGKAEQKLVLVHLGAPG